MRIHNNEPQSDQEESSKSKSSNLVTWYSAIKSVLSAAIGVQSDSNLQRDMEHSNPVIFIVLGFLFTIFMVLSLILLVYWIIPN